MHDTLARLVERVLPAASYRQWVLTVRFLKRPCKSSNPANSGSRNRWRDLLFRTSRGDKTPLELFIAGIHGWGAGLRRRRDDGKQHSQCS